VMTTEKKSISGTGSRFSKPIYWSVVVAFVFIFMFLGFDLVRSMIATTKWVKDKNTEFQLTRENVSDSLSAIYPDLVEVQKKIAFTKSRLKMAAGDSTGLSLNLSDSTLSIEISGVTVHSVRIREIAVSKSFSGLDQTTLTGMFSSPLRIAHSRSTISREVIIDKFAPSDTSSAPASLNIPDTSFKEPVFMEFFLENGIRILVLQQDIITKSEKRSRLAFLLNRAFLQGQQRLNQMFRFKIPVYSPQIEIVIPGSDARAIYRALPEKGLVSVLL
jgi:hypothetical protein